MGHYRRGETGTYQTMSCGVWRVIPHPEWTPAFSVDCAYQKHHRGRLATESTTSRSSFCGGVAREDKPCNIVTVGPENSVRPQNQQDTGGFVTLPHDEFRSEDTEEISVIDARSIVEAYTKRRWPSGSKVALPALKTNRLLRYFD